jgi:hypothetical protein
MDTPLDAAVTHINAWLVEAYRRQAAMARILNRRRMRSAARRWPRLSTFTCGMRHAGHMPTVCIARPA